jgi:hypothetical protein
MCPVPVNHSLRCLRTPALGRPIATILHHLSDGAPGVGLLILRLVIGVTAGLHGTVFLASYD